jgi:hypothetical protein
MFLALIGTADQPLSTLVSFIAFALQAKSWLRDGVMIGSGACKVVLLQ